jgi:tRNA1Val (adenine37-N6)-methyltransferase
MNSYFKFKQFTIQQDKCAMKVCTDACLFGAWAANYLVTQKINPATILDIGTGTGLLSLMLAQKTDAAITAVEIEEAAYTQATENIAASIFKNKITVHLADITKHIFPNKFDTIICNPPFFEDQLKSNNLARNAAMHATTLSYEALAKAINENLTENGNAFLLLPHYAIAQFEKIFAGENLFVQHIVHVKHSPTHPFFRAILRIGKSSVSKTLEEISIKEIDREYSESFVGLLKDYYLYL